MKKNLIGMSFGQWTVLIEAPDSAPKKVRWTCRCACGTERSVQAGSLLNGSSKTCGQCETHLEGKVFGRYTVISRAENVAKAISNKGSGLVAYLCLCECGVEKVVRKCHLIEGRIVSCGCHKNEMARMPKPANTTHGYNTKATMAKVGTRYRHLWNDFKLTPEAYADLLQTQGGTCAICKQMPDSVLHVDHDHTCCPAKKKTCGRCVRGLLCGPCNYGLGNFADSIERMKAAITYLQRQTS